MVSTGGPLLLPLLLLLPPPLPTTVAAPPHPDLVVSLPGLDVAPPFDQYAGFLQGVASSSNLFYWLVESQSDSPLDDPLVLWLQGGPGCSSLIGLLTEHGPFKVAPPQGTHSGARINAVGPSTTPRLLTNYGSSWNKNANVLYLETPACVGFSFGGSERTGDNVTCADNVAFLRHFYARHPRYNGRPLYVTGESHAGVYVPMLAQALLQAKIPQVKLEGFAVGNPSGLGAAGWDYSYATFMANHGLLSEAQLANATRACNGSSQTPDECRAVMLEFAEGNLYGIDPYNIYRACIGDGPSLHGGCAPRYAEDKEWGVPLRHRPMAAAPAAVGKVYTGADTCTIPCTDFTALRAYLDDPAVREALHVPTVDSDARGGGLPWMPCGALDWVFPYNKSKVPDIYRAIAGNPLRVLVFSGDVDSCVPFINTRRKVSTLGFLPAPGTQGDYRRWMVADSNNRTQIGGYTQSFVRREKILDGDGGVMSLLAAAMAEPMIALTFATVKGAGHMVASDKPTAALALFTRFLQGNPL